MSDRSYGRRFEHHSNYYPSNQATDGYGHSQRRYNSYQRTSNYSETTYGQHSYIAGPPRASVQPVSRSGPYGADNIQILCGSPLREPGYEDRMEESTAAPPAREKTPPPRPPSPVYLDISSESPSQLSSTADVRKLLVLDLNGTLCLRSARTRVKTGETNVRSVFPRPYMGVFCSYLFSESTRRWLDVMVWSSARPHNVDDMVNFCFGSHKRRLHAVWARDTLGLSVQSYNSKVQTHKDLKKPWEKLPSLIARRDGTPSGSSSDGLASARRSHHKKSRHSRTPPTEDQKEILHSARTTILLDDSPLKAVRQPYNHLCICEYTSSRRQHDLSSFTAESLRIELAAVASSPPSVDSAIAVDEHEHEKGRRIEMSPVSRKRKRLEQLEQQRVQTLAAGAQPADYDETLLAIIGVLDEIKTQANVAAWIRSGGLWRSRGDVAGDGGVATENGPGGADLSGGEEGDARARARARVFSPPPRDSAGPSGENAIEGGGGKARRKPRWRTNKREKTDAEANASADADAATETVPAGNDASTLAAPLPSAPVPPIDGSAAGGTSKEAEGEKGEKKVPMWFEDEVTLQYWIGRGRMALDELGIAVQHGMTR